MKFTVCLQIFRTSKISWNWMYPGMVSDFFIIILIFNHFAILWLGIIIENLIFIVSIDVNIFLDAFFFLFFYFLFHMIDTSSFYPQLRIKHVYMWTIVNKSWIESVIMRVQRDWIKRSKVKRNELLTELQFGHLLHIWVE